MDTSKYKALFLKETGEHISSIETGLLSLESREGTLKTIDTIFRGFHSIKGMSASMGYDDLARLSHTLEDILGRYRKEKRLPAGEAITLFLKGVDFLKEIVQAVSDGSERTFNVEGFIATLKGNHDKVSDEQQGGAQQPGEPKGVHKLDLPKSIKVEGSLFDDLLVVVGELLSVRSGLVEYGDGASEMELEENIHRLGKSLERLYTMILEARMLPVEDLTHNLPRMVRDMSKGCGKEVDLSVSGKEIKLDKLVLEKMGDPLIHLVRNAIDHGIEPPVERQKRGKPPKGRLSISVRRRPENVVMEIRDDGRGINITALREKALKMGTPPDRLEGMSKKDLLLMTCLPGMSLAEEVTDISGRGVGMDIVKEGVESISGSMEMDSTEGEGTVIRAYLPLSVSIINVLMLHFGEEMFALPLAHIVRIVEV
ncbi:MAG: hypothetical protein GY721_05470, partial [Deltaproteobacteria bacterium]|nr:hypothetical protein [Deltaproteobacteria bacterium]